MSADAAHAEHSTEPGPQAADTQLYRHALHGLINVGANLAQHLNAQANAQAAQQASAPAPRPTPAPHASDPQPAPQATDAQPAPAPAPAPDALIRLAAAFDQVARAVRRCIAQAQALDTPKQPARNPAPDRTAARKRIIRAVEDTIQRPPDNPDFEPPEVLLPEFRERMDAPDLDDDIATRPVEDIIKDIVRDLGLAALPGTHLWKRRTPADLAELCARAAAPSSPAWSAARPPGPVPQDGHPAAAQPAPAPAPADEREPAGPAKPAAIPRVQPGPTDAGPVHRGPVHPGSGLPLDPAEAVATVLRHAARTDARWRPPPED
jgi:hypothetical protein